MSDFDPALDVVHPSGHLLFRSCRGGYLHSVTLTEEAMESDAQTLAEAVMLAADVSFLKAAAQVRGEIIATGHTPSAALPTAGDLAAAEASLSAHELMGRDRIPVD